MMNYRKSYNPYLKGLRPRKFFSDVKKKTEGDSRTKDIRKFNPDWNKDKNGLKRA